uniref:Uncharacterized protein n=1 Tax=Megaselia scalaris TaxID=36166 RepID=T1GJL5_MEGSC
MEQLLSIIAHLITPQSEDNTEDVPPPTVSELFFLVTTDMYCPFKEPDGLRTCYKSELET